ncbi:xenotropic and polytropic retrovirus receptor 1-like isoform X3 [Ceratitis capitata]|uniref:xenotropic and polytropic retrovirus receptor 1-like isoform X3 n=1 Tax=Ceratitis capitata TaxID=7213 RepID=UPI0006188EBA|nr:xenotropic and polytropic retrovirus receptor 1-like isoform X3 [Ceratitis capitata]
MKFTERLATFLTPEWRSQYINYEQLKGMLTSAVDNAPADQSDLRAVQSYFAVFDDRFFERCDMELQKVNTFFAEKLAEAKRKQVALKSELKKSLSDAEQRGRMSKRDFTTVLSKRKTRDFRFAFSELYLSLVLLQNYQTLNHTGFRKILKKHDKLLRNTTGKDWFNVNVNNAFFYTNREIMNLIHETEDVVTNYLESGDRQRAMKRLRVPPLEDTHHPWTSFRVGLYSGALVVLLSSLAISLYMTELSADNLLACARLFRAPYSIALYLALISINIYGWRKAGVNHVLIFELDPRQYLTAAHVMEIAIALAVVITITLIAFIHASYLRTPRFVFPLALLIIMTVFLINPLPIFNLSARKWFLKVMARVVCAPFFHVGFAEFWLGDQLNSLAYCLVDYAYTICFYCTNPDLENADDPNSCVARNTVLFPVVLALPAWFRLAQCLRRYHDTRRVFPFIVNAGKYSMTFVVALFGYLMAGTRLSYEYFFDNPFVWFFIISNVVQTVYCLAWDMIMDFGVLKKFTGENIFLRDQLLYPTGFYYFAIIENFISRIFWAIKLYLYQQEYMVVFHSNTIASGLEMFRRYIWNYFRLENEHLFNAGKFRAVRDIFVVPIDPDDELQLQRMMDEVDGAINRSSVENGNVIDMKED